MKDSVAICFLIFLSALVNSGCGRDLPHQKVAGARPTTISINGSLGRGVLLSNSSTGIVFLLTARHVATYKGCFKGDLTIDFECRDGKHVTKRIVQGEKRWMTTARPDIDMAWIQLRKEELPDGDNFRVALLPSPKLSWSDLKGRQLLVASYQDKMALSIGRLNVENVSASGNQNLLRVTQSVEGLQVKIVPSESGSPVFLPIGKEMDLIGIITITNSKDEAGFLPVSLVAERIRNNLNGFQVLRLSDCKELW